MRATQYKFRHYTPDPDGGADLLLWASDGPGRSEDITDPIRRGSDADFDLIGSQLWTPNALTDEGEIDMLDVYFEDQAVRSTLYFGLTSANPSESSTLASITELAVSNGYARIAVARGTDWSAPASGSTTSVTKQFSASGTWTGATDLFICTSASGTSGLFIAFSALSQTRTLGNGDTLDVSMAVSLN